MLSLTVLRLTGLSCTVLAQGPGWLQADSGWAVFLTYLLLLLLGRETEQPGAGAAGLLSLREVWMGVN